MGTCPVTGQPAIECHEIVGGGDRHKTKKDPAFWLAVSRDGHEEIQYWPKSKQLAVKLLADPTRFDLARFNEIYTGKEGKLSFADIAPHLELRK